MGTTSSWPERDACAATPALRRTLSERDAWDIAMAWHKPLRGVVQLDAAFPRLWNVGGSGQERRAPFMIIERFEWITFDFAMVRGIDEAVRAARASTIAWWALSCCPGFDPSENAVFWKRVFSVLTRSAMNPPDITDCTRLFESTEFPRICFRWRNGLPLHLLRKDPRHQDPKLDAILEQLRPFMLRSRQQRAVKIAIGVEEKSSELECFLRDLPQTKYPKLPVFRLVSFFSRTYELAKAIGTGTDIPTHVYKLQPLWSGETIGLGMKALLQEAEPEDHPIVHKLALCPHEPLLLPESADGLYEHEFKAWCSMLPHLRWIRGVSNLSEGQSININDANAAWLGYALFHPDQASFRDLSLGLSYSHRFALDALRRMAVGNNLRVKRDQRTPTMTGYQQVKVSDEAMVLWQPDANAQTIMYTVPSSYWLTVCEIADFTTPQWIPVVLPGHGIGWIQPEDIIDRQTRAPAVSCVRRLRLVITEGANENGLLSDDSKTLLLDTLSVLGTQLTSLDVDTFCELDAATVHSLLQTCPALTALRIHHNGSYWVHERLPLMDTLPRLQELELRIQDRLEPLVSSDLDDLVALHIVCSTRDRFTLNCDALRAVLARYVDLVDVQWECMSSQRKPRSFDTHRERTRKLLRLSPSDSLGFARVPLRLDAKLGFLSALYKHAHQHWPQEALELIFRYSSSARKRLLDVSDP